jgi:hypothetical protein
MNGTEQRQRHTAVRDIQSQINDLIAVVTALSEQIVKDRAETLAQFDDVSGRIRLRIQDIEACETALADEERIRENLRNSFWQRLRWLTGL